MVTLPIKAVLVFILALQGRVFWFGPYGLFSTNPIVELDGEWGPAWGPECCMRDTRGLLSVSDLFNVVNRRV